MNYPKYRFRMQVNGANERAVSPIYTNELTKEFEKESGEQFFREKIGSNLRFIASDYVFIMSQAFDAKYGIFIDISYDDGATWSEYWKGTFFRTDCKIDEDTKVVEVTPEPDDIYNVVLAGLDREYNLYDSAIVMRRVHYDKRPLVQLYIPGSTSVGCFLSGMWWEQEVTPESNIATLEAMHFAVNKTWRIATLTGNISTIMIAEEPTGALVNETDGTYTLVHEEQSGNPGYYRLVIKRNSDNVVLYAATNYLPLQFPPYNVTLYAVAGSGASGQVEVYVADTKILGRMIMDNPTPGGVPANELAANDLTDNRNYHYCLRYYQPDTIVATADKTTSPTQWGMYNDTLYYSAPNLSPSLGYGTFYPVARDTWGEFSVWYSFASIDTQVEQAARQEKVFNDTYPLARVIRQLLINIGAGNVAHSESSTYSRFLYNTNPLTNMRFYYSLMQKSNAKNADYDQPARKAMITLRQVLDMLKKCFRCYWWIEPYPTPSSVYTHRLRIEHISYFMRGGAYSGNPVVGRDLTAEYVERNGKPWAYARGQYSFDKIEMPKRYEFGWMDDATDYFKGFPIDILSNYVDAERVDNIRVDNFSSDLDYILLNPRNISDDGFVLLAAQLDNGQYKLPYITITKGNDDFILQNGYVSYHFLQAYYRYDMPAPTYQIQGTTYTALGAKKCKVQEISFPCYQDLDLQKLIKTTLGNGVIEKLSVNLCSRNGKATLKYDTE